MVRKVKWLRRAVARDLPGNRMSAASQKNVAWLLETFSPFWFMEVTQTGKTSKPPKITHAVDMLRSAEFCEATSALVFPVRRGREHCDACPRRKRACLECEHSGGTFEARS